MSNKLNEEVENNTKSVNKTETEIKEAETARAAAEDKRVSAEKNRETAESNRVDAETKRQEDTKEAIKNCNTATEKALEAVEDVQGAIDIDDTAPADVKTYSSSQKDTVMFVYGFYKCLSEGGSAAAALEKLEDAGSVIKGDERQKDMETVQQRIKLKELPEENTAQQKTTQQREMITFVTAEDTKKSWSEEDLEKGKFLLYFAVAVVLALAGVILKDAGIYLIYQLTGMYFQPWVIPVTFLAVAFVFGLKGLRIFIDDRHKNFKNHDDGEFWQDSQRPDYSMMGEGETTLLAPKMTEDILVLKRASGDCFEQDVIYVTSTPFIIGKQYEAVNYHLSDNVVSRRHIEIRKEGRQYEVMDLSSTNGTWLNGSKLDSGVAYEIKQSDMLKIANIPFSVDLRVRQ